MRITSGMVTDTMLNSLRDNMRRIEKLHQQVTTGKRINRPSDDPTAVGRALIYRAGVAQGEQYIRTMDSSLTWLGATDNTLDSVTQQLQRARELAVQGANAALAPPQQQAIAAELEQVFRQVGHLANASLRGQRLFGGLKIDADPFTLSPGPPAMPTYNGDPDPAGQMLREIDAGLTIAINVHGDKAFTSSFRALVDLYNHLSAGDGAAVSADLAALDAAMDDVLSVRADLGARVNRIESARDRQETVQVRLQDLLSKVEDVEFEEAISKFMVQDTAYKAALTASGKALQPSLLDYLR